VVICCAALPLALAALGGVTATVVFGSVGLAIGFAAVLIVVAIALRRSSSCASLLREGTTPAQASTGTLDHGTARED